MREWDGWAERRTIVSRKELRVVSHAAVGIAAGLGAFASGAAAAEAGDTVLRTVWSAAGGHVATLGGMVAALSREPSVLYVALLAVTALGLGLLSIRSLSTARAITVRPKRRQPPSDPRDRLEL
jgi:hypothetical protein